MKDYGVKSLVLVRTLTPLHIGMGRSAGVVDLPIERDGFGLPYIPASGIKGAIGARLPEKEREELCGTREKVGAFIPLDASLVTIPVRSLKGVWVSACSPMTLRRFKVVAELAGRENIIKDLDEILQKVAGKPVAAPDPEKIAEDGYAILNEEFQLEVSPVRELESHAKKLKLLEEEEWRFVVLQDDIFKNVIDRSLLRRARVRLGEGKKVESGALWTEEDVPPDTTFVTAFLYSKDRMQEMRKITELVGNYLIFGGHETVGRGIVRLEEL